MDRNKTMMQDFEWYLKPDASHWKRVAKEAPVLKAAGITSVWLPPAYKGASGITDVGYAVYDLYDLGEFNQKSTIPTKYGTKDEYLEAVRTLQQNNIEVLADVVLGHRMGADEKERIFAYGYDENDRIVEIQGKKKITVWTKFTLLMVFFLGKKIITVCLNFRFPVVIGNILISNGTGRIFMEQTMMLKVRKMASIDSLVKNGIVMLTANLVTMIILWAMT